MRSTATRTLSGGKTSGRSFIPWLIGAATATVFLPVLQCGFVNWDDDGNFLTNLNYRGLDWRQLRWMFTTFHMGPYQPLSWLTLGLDYSIWGMNPYGYHLSSLLLHAANGVLFYFVAASILSLVFSSSHEESFVFSGAGAAAMLFALHPLRVESVAWVTERRDVLSGLFFLLTVQFYLRAATAETPARYQKWLRLTLAVYVLSLLSKAVAMTMPVVLLALDFYPLRRLGGNGPWFARTEHNQKVWLEKIPFVVLAVVAGWVALLGQHASVAVRSLAQTSILQRMAQASYGLVFYLRKSIVPAGLSPLYQLPETFHPLDSPYLASGVVVLGLTVGLIAMRRRWPAGLATWVYYVAMVLPVSGIVQVGPQMVADRYSYLSCLGWALLAGGGVVKLRAYWQEHGWVAAGTTPTLIMLTAIGLSTLTWQQIHVWRDSRTLWRHAVTLDPESSIARDLLGNALADRGELDEAIKQYQKALQIKPSYALAHYNLAMTLADRGDLDGALGHYEAAVRFDPANANAHNNLAFILTRRGELDAAIEHYRRALEIEPEFSLARNNLAVTLAMRSKRDQANR